MRQISRRQVLKAATAIGIASAGAAASTGTAPAFAREDPLRLLRRSIRGRLVLPGSAEYASLATPRNLRYAALMPKAVVLCADESDAARAIRWARDTKTAFAIRGGGHNYADGSSSTGIIISTRAMKRGSLLDATLRLQAGALNSDLATLLAQGGAGTHLLPGGTCPNVGVAGLTLGGGIGPNAPWAGLSADRLRQVTMVTATGDVVTASARRNPDLFWALRGGAGGNFGIVTELAYDLVEIPTDRATTFLLDYPADQATASGVAWQQIRAGHERTVSGAWSVSTTATGPAARVRAQVLLGEADARSLMAPLLGIPSTSMEIAERSWWDAYAWYRTPISPSNTFWARSLYLNEDLARDVIDQQVAILSRFPQQANSYATLLLFGWVGGKVSDVEPEASAYVHRQARTLLRIETGWPNPQDPRRWPTQVPPAINTWMQELWEATVPHSTGSSYQNFPDPSLDDPERAYYGANLRRLRAVKSEWDPENIFRYGQSIPT